MRSPQSLHNGGGIESPSPRPRLHDPHFQSTVSVQKLRRFNILIFVFRLAAFSFSLAAAVFMLTNSRGTGSSTWYHFDALRFVVAANGIVALYSVFEMVASVWEISQGVTVLPEILQVWFDFGHDQVFGYLLLSANSAGATLARALKGMETCRADNTFCVQTNISIVLGFFGFLFLGISALISGFRVVCFILNGSRSHL